MEAQSDLSGLIPKRLGIYWLLFFFGVFSIAVLEYAYFQRETIRQFLKIETLAPLDVESPQGILCWGLTILLFMTAAVAFVNFRLGRKHNDPVSRRNAWFWSSVVLLLLSMDIQVTLRETLREVSIALIDTPLYGDGSVWWLGAYGFLFVLLGSRLLIDLSGYAPSMGLFLLAVAGIMTGTLIDLGMLPIPWEETEIVILRTSIKAVSALFLFLAVALFARRQVFRDPEVALRWFAKVWNQKMPIASSAAPTATGKEQKTSSPKQPVATALKENRLVSSSPKSGIILPATERPIVQKSVDEKKADVVLFSAGEGNSNNDDDFDLAHIA